MGISCQRVYTPTISQILFYRASFFILIRRKLLQKLFSKFLTKHHPSGRATIVFFCDKGYGITELQKLLVSFFLFTVPPHFCILNCQLIHVFPLMRTILFLFVFPLLTLLTPLLVIIISIYVHLKFSSIY